MGMQAVKVRAPIRPRERFLVFGSPVIGEDEIREVVECMRSGWLGTGQKTACFEKEFMEYKGARFAMAVSSCTAALHLSLVASGVGPGDEVITTPLTFCSTVNAIIHAGATPVLADVDPETLNIDPDRVMIKITPKTRAIVPVHFAGRPCRMDRIMDIAKDAGLKVVEDCAHAIEAKYRGKSTGTFGDFGCFSFYATKNITTGEGGMVIADNADDAKRVKALSLHGLSADAWKRFSSSGYRHYSVEAAGFKYNMTDMQAGLGIHQLRRIEERLLRRAEVWSHYDSVLSRLPITLPPPPELGTRHARHLYTIMIDEKRSGISRDDFLVAMNAENIGVGVHYVSLPEYPFYQRMLGWRPEDYPVALGAGRRVASIPLSAKLTDDDVQDVVEAIKRTLGAR